MQLTVMGYPGDVLKAVFCPDKIRQRRAKETVTMELTHERQVALAAVKTCGKRFFATGGGQHLTADDGFIVAEMCFCETAVKEKEKEKKSRMEGNAKRDAALIVLNRLENHLDDNVDALLSKELETLLKWKGVQVLKMGDKVAKRSLYKKIVEEGGGVKTAYSWMDANEEELEALKNAPIEMADTSYGRYEAEQKRNVVRVCRKMTPKERENLRRSLDKMDASAAAAVDAADAENEPTNIPPI
jgi:hypothetical protein